MPPGDRERNNFKISAFGVLFCTPSIARKFSKMLLPAALALLEAMPEGPVSVIARFAYAARVPVIDTRPVTDDAVLAAVRIMKM